MCQPNVSVIVPVYNAEKYLRECLDSLVNQTLSNIEIIVVNDGSTDSSPSIINEYAIKFNNVVVVNQENKGNAKAKATGLDIAKGEYIGFVDADDFVKTDMYQCMYKTAIENDADCVICNYNFYPLKIKTKEKWFKEYHGQIDWKFIERNTQLWNKIVKRELLENIKIKESLFNGSEGAYINVLLHANKIITLQDKELYFYRVGELSTSSNYNNTKFYIKNIEDTSKQVNYIINTKHEQELYEYFQYRIIYAILQVLIIVAFNREKQEYLKWKKSLHEMNYLKNPFLREILLDNHGYKKAFVILYIVPKSYFLTMIISNLYLNK